VKFKIFISSVQQEFATERVAIAEHLRQHKLLHEYFDIYLFEEGAASGATPAAVYLDEVEGADIYLGIFGKDYGYEFDDGLSPTEMEYNLAAQLYTERWIYISGDATIKRHPKMAALIHRVGGEVARKRVIDIDALIHQVESSAYKFLKQKGVIESKEFDNSLHTYATWSDVSDDLIRDFVVLARDKRDFPLSVDSTKQDVLAHLGLSRDGKLFNSALLLFADHPQRYFPAATVKCAHFHGYEVSKPIPDLREYEGTVLAQSAQAIDFVLSKISRKTGDRSRSNRVDTSYEIPRSVIAEAIINAIAHRDYQSTASIQVSVYKDRVEIWNPGSLPSGLTIDRLKEAHGSFPRNPLLAKCLFNTGDIERYGTGTKEIFDRRYLTELKKPV